MSISQSSNATAVITGVAALVRSKYPSMSNQDVMARIRATSGPTCGMPAAWFDVVNAAAAVGGICYNRQVFGLENVNSEYGGANQRYSTVASGGAAPLTYTWYDAGTNQQLGTGTGLWYSFYRGNYAVLLKVVVTDPATGVQEVSFTKAINVYKTGMRAITLGGPNVINPRATCSWSATPDGGVGPYYYTWQVNGTTVLEGYDASVFTGNNGGASFRLDVVVRDAEQTLSNAGTYVGIDQNLAGCGAGNPI